MSGKRAWHARCIVVGMMFDPALAQVCLSAFMGLTVGLFTLCYSGIVGE